MCELFAASARRPVNVNLSFETFSRRGGATGPHADGWGIAFFEGPDAQILRESEAAAHSECARFVEHHDLRSNLVISHIRKATMGARTLRNTQPFARELGGRLHVFAHNGNLENLRRQPWRRLDAYLPLGDTDSEQAFCTLMGEMRGLWRRVQGLPPLADRLEVVSTFAHRISRLGPANFLYSDGDVLFAHGHRRTQEDGSIVAPGLHLLRRTCTEPTVHELEGAKIRTDTARQEVVLIASRPLSDEPWQPLMEGEIVAIANGRVLANSLPPPRREYGTATTSADGDAALVAAG
ncbi:MAG: class II glutamine amidotransferase [Deltaproteobacteria bacterium]|nr:class II glutamine amidotransferase [Deltaproteobacteria bacterium]